MRFLAALLRDIEEMSPTTTSQQTPARSPTTTDATDPRDLQAAIVSALDLDLFPLRGYRSRDYLEAALEAGFGPRALATAHDVSRRSIYRAADVHGIDLQQPPTSGTARLLWELDSEAVPGDSA